MRAKQLLHFAIQGANILGKFLLMIGMARYLTLKELGLYATVIAAFGILQPLMNLQFGRYTYRQCASATPPEVVGYVRHYLLLLLCMLCVGAPLMGMYVGASLEASHVAWIVALLVANVLAMEFSNLLMVRQYSTRYMLSVFIGQSGWIYLLLGLWAMELRAPSLLDIWQFWTYSALASLALSIAVVRHYPWISTHWHWLWGWLKKGLALSPVNLTALLCGIGILNSSIFFVEYLHGLEVAGIYGFFFAVVLGIRQWVMGGAYVMQEPKLFRCFDAQDRPGFRREARVMFRDSLLAYVAACVVAVPGIYLVLAVTANAIPESAMPLYWGFLFTACAVLLCDLGQVIGFARHAWKRLALLNAIVLVWHLLCCVLLLPVIAYQYAFVPLLLSSMLRAALYYFFLNTPEERTS
jgi:hypothetical protein